MKRKIICKKCKLLKYNFARMMCDKCYKEWYYYTRRTSKNIICEKCKLPKNHWSRGMCNSCYRKWYNLNMRDRLKKSKNGRRLITNVCKSWKDFTNDDKKRYRSLLNMCKNIK